MKRAREDEVDSNDSKGAASEQIKSSARAAPVAARGPAISCSQREPFLPVAVDNATRSAVQNLTLELVFGAANVSSNTRRFLGERPSPAILAVLISLTLSRIVLTIVLSTIILPHIYNGSINTPFANLVLSANVNFALTPSRIYVSLCSRFAPEPERSTPLQYAQSNT